jgi:hypothetical protein
MDQGPRRDLVILLADKNAELALDGILRSRGRSLSIRPVQYRIYVHPERDPGCLLKAGDFLRPFRDEFSHALVLFDKEGCGRNRVGREDLEAEVVRQLSNSGWGDRAACIVVDPELEVWVWSDSPHVDSILGWAGQEPNLRTWLSKEALLNDHRAKPARPKETLEAALRLARKPRSSSLYGQLARTVSLSRCVDPAFVKLRSTLRQWFGA